jgi:3-oxoadipate enol-lactonase
MSELERVTVGDGAIAYSERGDGEPLLLLHSGFVADGMRPLLDQPALRDYRTIAYHRRGYGHSDAAGGSRSLAQMAEDAAGLLDALGIDRAHLAGHSMGAVVAIQLALSRPERVRSLTMMEPLLGFLLTPEAAALVDQTAAAALPKFAAGDGEGALEAWLSSAFGPGFGEVLERTLPGAWEQAVADTPASFGVELPALQGWPVGPADLERIAVPTLSVVHAANDWPGFAEIHAGLLAAVPGCQEAVVAMPSHLLHMADAPPVAEALAAFLAGQTDPGGRP